MTDQDLDRLEALANQKRGRGYREEQALIKAVPALIAEVRRLRATVERVREKHLLQGAALNDYETSVADLRAGIKRLQEDVERVREALSGHPQCDKYADDDVITCGWKSAVRSVQWALDGEDEE